ncbi:unnamed protein product [Oikopleura dioica]|uniref:Oikosin 13 n=1 Tax=Oikopleura dioica TaxID=34765 RepID=E4WT88_OIKDI|nr:unnamed protein product [Oikopleura dioica]CCG00921.1 oikosin 13 [Oikopleura dioica]
MKLFSAFLAGSALSQERLPAVQEACAAFRDEIKANNTIAGDGVWDCPKLSKNSKKTACKAKCPGNTIPEFKKAAFKVKCGNEETAPSWSSTIKTKPADGVLSCHANLCSVGTENGLIMNGSLLLKGKKNKGGKVVESYALKCKNEKKKRKGTVKCDSDTGLFSSDNIPDYQTTCEAASKVYEKYTCDFAHAAQGSGVLDGKVFFERVVGKKKDKVVISGTVSSTDATFDAGQHGIHVHEVKYIHGLDWSNDGAGQCKGANGHFGLDGQSHGFAANKLPNRHTGDLGSITVTGNRRSGTSSTFEIDDKVVSLDPASNMFIGDRTIVIHADPDDGTTQPTGNAGSRPGCCAIKPIRYTCDFTGNGGDINGTAFNDIAGAVDLRYADGKVTITGALTGVPVGKHGFHVHQNGALTNSCGDTGSHFQVDAANEIHGTPDKKLGKRHAGDIGNLVATADGATANFMDSIVSLIDSEDTFIGGRAIVIHQMEDDGNPTGDADSTGGAGFKLACCTIVEQDYAPTE